MKYNILVVKNRYSKNPNFKKGLDWFKEHTPIDIVMTDHIDTNFEITTRIVGNDTFKGVIPGDDIFEKLQSVVPKNKYHAVVFLFGNELNGIRVNAAMTRPIWPGTYLIVLYQDGDKGRALNHEIIHTFFHRLKAQGIQINDPMDSVLHEGQLKHYFNDSSLNANPSNRTIAKELLAPYWNKVVAFSTPTSIPAPIPTLEYKWFKLSEPTGRGHTFEKLHPQLRKMLDNAREIAKTPFVITSGFRTIQENQAVGGVPNSAHTKGLAADIACTNNHKRSDIIRGILNSGTPVFLEIGKKHIHVDIDSSIHELGQTIIE